MKIRRALSRPSSCVDPTRFRVRVALCRRSDLLQVYGGLRNFAIVGEIIVERMFRLARNMRIS